MPELQEAGEVMADKRANNGIEPGKTVRNINRVPLSNADWERFERARGKYDATAGWIAGEAIRKWMNWRKL